MKCSKYFGAKWRRFIKSETILAPKGASRFKTQNIRYDTIFTRKSEYLHCKPNQTALVTNRRQHCEHYLKNICFKEKWRTL
jgi:hypothetical protein